MNKKKRKQLVALIELVLATLIAIWVVRVANKRPSYDTTPTSQPATTLPKRPHYTVPKGNTSRYKLNDPHSRGYDQGFNQGLEDGKNGERFECGYDDSLPTPATMPPATDKDTKRDMPTATLKAEGFGEHDRRCHAHSPSPLRHLQQTERYYIFVRQKSD